MAHRTGQDRHQFGLFPTPLDDLIAPDKIIRVIDVFVDKLDLKKLGFEHGRTRKTGAPPYELDRADAALATGKNPRSAPKSSTKDGIAFGDRGRRRNLNIFKKAASFFTAHEDSSDA